MTSFSLSAFFGLKPTFVRSFQQVIFYNHWVFLCLLLKALRHYGSLPNFTLPNLTRLSMNMNLVNNKWSFGECDFRTMRLEPAI